MATGTGTASDSLTLLTQQATAAFQAGDQAALKKSCQEIFARDALNLTALELTGVAAYQTGNLEESERILRRAAEAHPKEARIANTLGVVVAKQGRPSDALECYRQAAAADPHYPQPQINIGNLLCRMGRVDEGLAAYQGALALDSNSAEIHFNIGNALRALSRPDEAMESFRRAQALAPTLAAAKINLGILLTQENRLEEALEVLAAAAAQAPDLAEAQLALGDVLKRQRRWQESGAAYLRALEIDPGVMRWRKHFSLGLACAESGDYDTAAEILQAPIRLIYRLGTRPPEDAVFEMSRFKLAHDADQLSYLRDRGVIGPDYDAVISEYRSLGAEVAKRELMFEQSVTARPLLGATFNRLVHLAEAPTLRGGAVNRDLDRAAIEAAYFQRDPPATYCDSLLTPEALAYLHRFCLDSTVWWQLEHTNEVGSSLNNGFAAPLLLQIAHELREALPGILGAHPFTTLWAYKYYAPTKDPGALNTSSGLDIHGDDGAVSINFWIVPDEANLDPYSGGLTFWNRAAPPEYFKAGSRQERLEILRPVIKAAGTPALSVPYRCNRAAIFHAGLLHQTSQFQFRDAYPDRRISITLIYGRRAR